MENDYGGNMQKFMQSPDYEAIVGVFDGDSRRIQFKDLTYRARFMKRMPPPMAATAIRGAFMRPEQARRRAAYFHIPFCRLRCAYCGFYKNAVDEEQQSSYVEALLQEMDLVGGSPYARAHVFQAVFFGGGTPGVLTAKQIERMLTKMRKVLPLAENCEITFESSVCDMDMEKLQACIDGGINRLSFGIQTFDTDIRRSLGRPDDRPTLLKKMCAFKGSGAKMIIDLIYGLPGQTEEILLRDLQTALDCGVDGLDLYKLQILPNSPLGERMKRGQASYGCDQNLLADLFCSGATFLEQNGCVRLSCCHWDVSKGESKYNSMAKSGADVLAFGSGSGGRIAACQYMKEPAFSAYIEQVKSGVFPVIAASRQSAQYELLETLCGQVDSGKLDFNAIRAQYGLDLETLLTPILKTWATYQLLQKAASGCYIFTIEGLYWYKQMLRVILHAVEFILYGEMHPEEAGRSEMAMGAMKNLK